MGSQPANTVVVVGADHPTGLGVARALAGNKVRLVGLFNNYSPCCRSKWWNRLIPITEPDKIADQLLDLAREFNDKPVLFVAADSMVKQVSDQRERLQPHYLFRLPSPDIVDCFLDKTAFHQWALDHGFKVPASHICQTGDELHDCLASMQFPVIVKPYEKTAHWDHFSPVHKAFKLRRREDLDNIPFDLFAATSKVLVQQWVPGGDRDVYFCLVYYDGNGRKMAAYTGRKLFQWPPLCGSTAAAVGVQVPLVSAITSALFDMADYQGLGSLEFKRSTRDGQLYIIEPTIGRGDLQSNVAMAGGVNLIAVAWSEMTGRPCGAGQTGNGVWIHEEGLLEAMRANYGINENRLSDLLRLIRPKIAFALFEAKDPLPFIQLLKVKIGHLKP